MKLINKIKNLFGYPRLSVKQLKKDCINVIDIPTGMMPKSKAEEYARNLIKRFREVVPEEYKIVYMPVNSFTGNSQIKYMHKGVLNILEVNVSSMLNQEKADEYIDKMNQMVNNIEGYDIKVVRKII